MVRFEALWVTGIILRTNDSDLYPSAEKEPYSDLIIYIVLAFCNIMVLVIFVRFLSSMASTQEQGVETRLAQKIVDAAAEHTLRQVMDAREELWYCLLDKAQAKLSELMDENHPAFKVLKITIQIVKDDEWCGDYIGMTGKKALAEDLTLLVECPSSNEVALVVFEVAKKLCNPRVMQHLTDLAAVEIRAHLERVGTDLLQVELAVQSVRCCRQGPQSIDMLSRHLIQFAELTVQDPICCAGPGFSRRVMHLVHALASDLCGGNRKFGKVMWSIAELAAQQMREQQVSPVAVALVHPLIKKAVKQCTKITVEEDESEDESEDVDDADVDFVDLMLEFKEITSCEEPVAATRKLLSVAEAVLGKGQVLQHMRCEVCTIVSKALDLITSADWTAAVMTCRCQECGPQNELETLLMVIEAECAHSDQEQCLHVADAVRSFVQDICHGKDMHAAERSLNSAIGSEIELPAYTARSEFVTLAQELKTAITHLGVDAVHMHVACAVVMHATSYARDYDIQSLRQQCSIVMHASSKHEANAEIRQLCSLVAGAEQSVKLFQRVLLSWMQQTWHGLQQQGLNGALDLMLGAACVRWVNA